MSINIWETPSKNTITLHCQSMNCRYKKKLKCTLITTLFPYIGSTQSHHWVHEGLKKFQAKLPTSYKIIPLLASPFSKSTIPRKTIRMNDCVCKRFFKFQSCCEIHSFFSDNTVNFNRTTRLIFEHSPSKVKVFFYEH